MWQARQTSEANGRVRRYAVLQEDQALSFRQAMTLLHDSPDFRQFLEGTLAGVPFDAFRWETPAVTQAHFERDFEFVTLDSPGLDVPPDQETFRKQFQSHTAQGVAAFSNLGGDALLIVPCPAHAEANYSHLAAFLREAPEAQRHAFWQQIGASMLQRVGQHPIWLNTAGAGVAWLHVRLDSRPKYYWYAAYKNPC